MGLKKIIKLYEQGSVSICGMKGRGKDMLTGNVVVRRGRPYISNLNYGGLYYPYKYQEIDIPSTYEDINKGTVKPYEFKYEDGTDIYLSDCGIYFPSQYCNELNKHYRGLPTFMALSRQLGDCSVHTNSQALNRVWDKIREQSDTYILCRKCIYIKCLKLVIQKITIYDKFESACERRLPLKIPLPFLAGRKLKTEKAIRLAEYEASHGVIKNKFLIYRNKSTYDTRYFKTLMKGETNEDKK